MNDTAFGISEDDVHNVLQNHHDRLTAATGADLESLARDLFNDLDHGAVERAALRGGTELDQQTEAAYEEVETQLIEFEVLRARETSEAALYQPSQR